VSGSKCPNCGFGPRDVGGFPAYAPDLAQGGGGFEADYFAALACLEETSFWFQARNDLIEWALGAHCPSPRSFLEVGCGTGYVLSRVAARFPQTEIHGSDVFIDGLRIAANRAPSATLIQMDARDIPYHDEFDALGAFDVLEHIEEDTEVLAQMCDALKPGGTLLLTVPQHAWLWSAADEHAHHVRRYSAEDLHRKLDVAGFAVQRSTSFVCLLLPAMYASRRLLGNTAGKSDQARELNLPRVLNRLAYGLMRAEIGLIKNGVNFSAGGSRLVVARNARKGRS
jgi:SAM-dependent methyltransferase